jgi:hypothetical protein
LRKYSDGTATSSYEDLTNKGRQMSTHEARSFSETHLRAAVRQVAFERVIGGKNMATWKQPLRMLFILVTGWTIFAPFSILREMYLAGSLAAPFLLPQRYRFKTRIWAASYWEHETVTRDFAGCPLETPVWWLSDNGFNTFTGCLLRFVAVPNAILGGPFLVKAISIDLTYLLLRRFAGDIVQIPARIWEAADLSSYRLGILVAAVLLSSVGVLNIHWFAALRSYRALWPVAKGIRFWYMLISITYGLPDSPFNSNGGHNIFIQAALALQCTHWAFPHALNGDHAPFTGLGRDNPSPVCIVLFTTCLLDIAFCSWWRWGSPAVVRPWHFPGLRVLAAAPVAPPQPPALVFAALPPPPAVPAPVQPAAPPAAVAPPIIAQNVFAMPGGQNPFAAWAMALPNMPFVTFRQAAGVLPMPVLPLANVAGLCVWDTLGTVFGVAPLTLLAIFLAQEPVANHPLFLGGDVPVLDLPRVMAFFPAGGSVYRCAGPDVNPTIPPGAPPFVGPGVPAPGWPTFVASLTGNGPYHISLRPPGVANIMPPPMAAGAIGVASQRLRFLDISKNLQLPQVYATVYQALLGAVINTAALAVGFGAVTPLPAFVPINPTALVPEVIPYQMGPADRVRARKLAADFNLYQEELRVRKINPDRACEALKFAAKNQTDRTVNFHLLNGVAGCGKSYALRALVTNFVAANQSVRFHTWNPVLRGDLETTFTPLLPYVDNHTFSTQCVPLFQPTTGVMIFDDAGLLPPGYIELFLYYAPMVTDVVFTFDPAQGKPPFAQGQAQSRTEGSTVDWLAALSTQYATTTRRLSLEVAALLGLPRAIAPGAQVSHGAIVLVSKPPRGIPIFVASPRFAQVKAYAGSPCYPFSDIQGLTVEGDIAIDLGGLTSGMTDNVMFMALTRGTGSIFLCIGGLMSTQAALVEESYGCSLILSTILALAQQQNCAILTPASDPFRMIARAVQAHLADCNPNVAQFAGSRGFQTVAGIDVRMQPAFWPHAPSQAFAVEDTAAYRRAIGGERFEGSKVAFDAFQRMDVPGVGTSRLTKIQHHLRHQLPLPNDTVISRPQEPEEIPIFDQQVVVDLGQDGVNPEFHLDRERSVTLQSLTAQVRPHESSLGLRHQTRDKETEALSLRERIRPAVPRVKSVDRADAKLLMKSISRWVDTSQSGFDYGLFNRCLDEQITSWVAHRTIGQLAASVAASPVDWDPNFVELFLKNQRVKKIGVATSHAKKGQIVTNVSHVQLFRDSVWALYAQKMLLRRTHRNIYLHIGKNVTAMQDWYKRYDWSGPLTACDYTGWDTGVDEKFSLFYRELFIRFGFPVDIADQFLATRHSRRSFLGPMPAMQASGDRYTWLCNTIGNMALTALVFNPDPNAPACFSGDDMVLRGSYHGSIPPRFKFIPKTLHGDELEFCGFMYGGPSLHISPAVLVHRGMQALGDGRLDRDYWDSYQFSLAFAQRDPLVPDAKLGKAMYLNQVARRLGRLQSPPPHLRVNIDHSLHERSLPLPARLLLTSRLDLNRARHRY